LRGKKKVKRAIKQNMQSKGIKTIFFETSVLKKSEIIFGFLSIRNKSILNLFKSTKAVIFYIIAL
jgi:hypothetical protein